MLKHSLNKTIITYLIIILLIGTILPIGHSDSEDPWWNTTWTYRKEITIDHTKVYANLINFPVLIKLLSDTDLAGNTQSTGNDIAFTDGQGNKLNHEIEYYNGATGMLYAWVNVTRLSSTTNTKMYMYYGNAGASNQQNRYGTWNSNYKAVYHLDENKPPYVDSTRNKNNITVANVNGTGMAQSGGIYKWQHFNGSSNYFVVPFAMTGAYTVEAIANPDKITASGVVYAQEQTTAPVSGIAMGVSSSGKIYVTDGTLSKGLSPSSTFTPARTTKWWADAVYAVGSKIWFYLNGDNQTLTSQSYFTNNVNRRTIGARYSGSYSLFWDGYIDEVRIASGTWNSSWLKTCYNNQYNPSSFYNLGHQEQISTSNKPLILSGENPTNNSINVNINIPSVSVMIQDPEGKSLNWSITTSPNVGCSSGANEFNGTKSCSITGLTYSTCYTWIVKANDGNKWTNKTFTFTTQTAPVNYPPVLRNPVPINRSTGIPPTITSLNITILDQEADLFNWSITTSPNIGSNSGFDETNGSKSCPISNLINATTYFWTVKAYDGHKWTNATFSFTTKSSSSQWWNHSWMYRKEINIDHVKVDADLVNFPVLINLNSDSDLSAYAQSDGDDIVFTDKYSNKLNHEIELYTNNTGRLIAWVNVTNLSSKIDTKLYLYYGNSACTNQQNQHGTWNSDYLFVHHMNETGTIYDSTSHGYSATNYGTTLDTNGKIGYCRYFDATTDRYDFGTATNLNPGTNSWTISLWTKVAYVNPYFQILNKWSSSSNSGFTVYLFNNGANKYNYIKVGDTVVTKKPYRYWDTSWSDGTWHYINAVINRNTNKIDVYLDGTLHNGFANTDLTGMGSFTSTANFRLYGGTNGRQDEFSIATTVRNASWIKTCYNNQNDPSTFLNLVNQPYTIPPDDSHSPIRKYFTTKKIIWSFDDYWINSDHHPPHKGFDGLSQQIHNYSGYVVINTPFIPSWIGQHYGNAIRNYSVVNEFAPYDPGFTQNHINLSLNFFNRSYISPGAHDWNHTQEENINHANLSYAYKIINYTLWNWYNNYHIKPNFWLGMGDNGNYNISLALQRFSETYWTVYAENFQTSNTTRFPNGIKPAVEYIGSPCDPLFGGITGKPCKTLQEAQQLFSNYSQNKEIVSIRGHPGPLNNSNQQQNLTLWQEWIDWIYQNYTLINMNFTQAIEYKIDRNSFIVEKNNNNNYTINLSLCQFNHTVLFSPPEYNTDQWILHDQDGQYIGLIQGDTFIRLEKDHCYYFTRLA